MTFFNPGLSKCHFLEEDHLMNATRAISFFLLLFTGIAARGQEASQAEPAQQMPQVEPVQQVPQAEPAQQVPQAGPAEEIVITATRTAQSAKEIPASVSIITSEDIQQRHALKVEDALKGLVGIDSTSAKPGGFPGAPVLRGMSGAYSGSPTQYLLDGLPIEPPLISNRQALLLVPPQGIDRIEVVRGPVSALYGPGAVGGVINIIPKKGRGSPSADVAIGGGSFSSYRLTASSSGSFLDHFDYSIVGQFYRTAGYKPLPDATSIIYDIEGRDQTDAKLNISLGYRPSDRGEVTGSFRYYNIDGAWLGGHPNYRFTQHGSTADLGYKWRFSDLAELKAKLLWASFRYSPTFDKDYENYDGDLSLLSKDVEDEGAWDVEVQGDFHLLAANTLTLGGSYNWGISSYSRADAFGSETSSGSSKSQVGGIYLQDQHKFGDLLVLNLGCRYDRYRFHGNVQSGESLPESNDNVLTYRAGLRLNPLKTTSLYASLGSAYLPALSGLKFRSDPSLNNPNLKPERSISYEVGLDQELWTMAKAKVSVFYTDYRDRIISVNIAPEDPFKTQYQNLGQVKVKGAELGLDAALADYWRPYANYTYTGAVITYDPSNPAAEGKTPAKTPKHKFNAGLVYDNPKIITARLEARFVGDQYFNNLETPMMKAAGYMVVDAKISREFPFGSYLRKATVSLAANNLFNRKYIEIQPLMKAPGFNLWCEIGARF
jgi:TonB-dependent siderophore receptor